MNVKVILLMVLVVSCVGACMTVKKVDPSTISRYEGFIQDGRTTKQEIQDRLGAAQSVYESGRILIYYVYLQDDGRVKLKGDGTCYASVLVFDKDDLLERHSMVKYGCK
jgi:hypothetical protein